MKKIVFIALMILLTGCEPVLTETQLAEKKRSCELNGQRPQLITDKLGRTINVACYAIVRYTAPQGVVK